MVALGSQAALNRRGQIDNSYPVNVKESVVIAASPSSKFNVNNQPDRDTLLPTASPVATKINLGQHLDYHRSVSCVFTHDFSTNSMHSDGGSLEANEKNPTRAEPASRSHSYHSLQGSLSHGLSYFCLLILFSTLAIVAQAQEDPFQVVFVAAGIGQPHPFLDALTDEERKPFYRMLTEDSKSFEFLANQERRLLSGIRIKYIKWYLDELPPGQRRLLVRMLAGDQDFTPAEWDVLEPIKEGGSKLLDWQVWPVFVAEGPRIGDHNWIFGFGENIFPTHTLVFAADDLFYEKNYPGVNRALDHWLECYQSVASISERFPEGRDPDVYRGRVRELRIGRRHKCIRIFGVPILTWGPARNVVYSDSVWKEQNDQFLGMWDTSIDSKESRDSTHRWLPFVNFFWLPIIVGVVFFKIRLRMRPRGNTVAKT